MTRLAIVLALLATPALGAPPPPGSEDAKIAVPYSDWIKAQQKPGGGSCCSEADGRPVEARIESDHWIAHVTPEHWPGVRDQWVQVPDVAIIPGTNPIGVPFLWLAVPHLSSPDDPRCPYCGGQDLGVDPGAALTVLCFAPPSGV